MSVSLKPANDSIKNLADALEILSATKLERDGVVRRFEIAYEQTWKAAQRILRENEVLAASDLPIKVDLVTPETCIEEYRENIQKQKVLWLTDV
jgi:hypothetical protein